MIVDALEQHATDCPRCQSLQPCDVAEALLRQLTYKLCPPVPVVLDLDGHVDSCLDCRPNALCERGRAIAHEIGTTYLQVGKRLPSGRPS